MDTCYCVQVLEFSVILFHRKLILGFVLGVSALLRIPQQVTLVVPKIMKDIVVR